MQPPKIATGLYVNWDSIIPVGTDVLRWVRNTAATTPRSVVLTEVEEAVYVLRKALQEGGREYLISQQLHASLDALFPQRVWKLGGNGFHMGKALYDMEVKPLVSYPHRPRGIMQASPSFFVAVDDDDLKHPIEAVRESDPNYDHMIFEFTENPREGIEQTGRLILSWDEMSSRGVFDKEFLKIATNGRRINVLILGYAHLLLPSHKNRTDELRQHLEHAGRPAVHLEVGEGSEESMAYAIETLVNHGCLDSLGANEKEAVRYLKARSESLEDLKDAAVETLKKLGIKRICIHSPTYAFSVAEKQTSKEAVALLDACSVAIATCLGRRTPETIREIQNQLETTSSLKTKEIGRFTVTILRTLYEPAPKILTGLGDAFAAIQAAKALS